MKHSTSRDFRINVAALQEASGSEDEDEEEEEEEGDETQEQVTTKIITQPNFSNFQYKIFLSPFL